MKEPIYEHEKRLMKSKFMDKDYCILKEEIATIMNWAFVFCCILILANFKGFNDRSSKKCSILKDLDNVKEIENHHNSLSSFINKL
jgi:hypothetical protein